MSVGASFGQVAQALAQEFPAIDWDAIPLDPITSDSPSVIDIGEHTGQRQLRLAVLATPHSPELRAAMAESITTASASAITAAADAGATAVALPLFATGDLGAQPRVAAAALIAGAQAVHRTVRKVIFFSLRGDHVQTIAQVWAALPLSARTTGEPATSAYSTDELAGGMAKDLVDPNECIPLARDGLGVKPYVSMLATVIAAKDTPLPLSIGVFGEWGAGKSFFMGMLRGQVKKLEGTPGQCAKIAQIGFNAWHYADANLWASLGDEIFRQLAEPARQPGEPDTEHLARLREGNLLREQLSAELEQRRQLTAVTERAQVEAAALKRKISEARESRKGRAVNLVTAVSKSASLRKQYAGLWRELGVDGDPVEQGELLADEIQGVRREVGELRRISRYRHGTAVLIAAGILLLAGLCLTAVVPDVRSVVIGICVVCAPLTAAGLKLMSAARAGLGRLRTLAREVQGALDDAMQEDVSALRQADVDAQIAERQLDEVVARIGELGRQLTELTPGRRLYAFIAERSRTDDYHGNLGLISTIRKDFEKLVALMTAPAGKHDGGPRPLDRIVLYIDDLDRCSPSQVVEVLQAVHLLLAFDLFVVVVGVDPRWLLRSLSAHYDRLIEADPVVRAGEWHVTPEDYLEKILNIPLVLPRMPPGSLARLLRGMVEGPPAEHVDDTEPEPADVTVDAAAGQDRPATSIPVEPGSQVAAQLDPAEPPKPPQPLTELELALLARLDRMIDTPRDAKRLINLYRMLRATRDLSAASAFLDHEYEAVVVLLGVCTAHGRLLGRLSDALLSRSSEEPWSDFVADLLPVKSEDQWTSRAVGRISGDEVVHWEHLHRSLSELEPLITLPDIRVFQTWVPRVRRFSYALSPSSR
ncbi:P-loop NTPase fold protein [Amycolatopsis eburnea]|uniref:KAP NTPase domain-containing protein n=1 Tax=Amycolatopsis eburnea TaxID=2267691 RepID=A0A3R9EHL9_9PSEU|nr:P-loop NTPase fold protein [Amycolatopsis eburnea]RSD07295.1 hypothetical protein EIY87_46430 [Amycolatopsis eburnea]